MTSIYHEVTVCKERMPSDHLSVQEKCIPWVQTRKPSPAAFFILDFNQNLLLITTYLVVTAIFSFFLSS